LALLRDEREELSLAVAGDGPERAALRALAERLGLASRVTWLGERRDLPQLMASAAAFVLPSRHEGSPFVVLEAMALERPIVATAVGGVVDLLDGGAAGRLVPPEDPVALARALAELVASPDASRERSRRALALLETRFSAARMAAETAGVYRELVA
jgi:glycosyltransferase involved in cell wall biosynthesis